MRQLPAQHFAEEWKGSKLPAELAGDVAAAGISATLISPLITAIDRSVWLMIKSRTWVNEKQSCR
jgi:hypothetical protein